MARVHIAGDFGGRGEGPTATRLEADLPDDGWDLIFNKQLTSPTGQSREIDVIIVAPNVVFVVEEKSWSGSIHGNENGWVLRSGESYPSPVNTVEMLAKRLAGYLRDAVPALRSSLSGHFVFTRVVLSDPDARCAVRDQRISTTVLKLSEAAEDLKRFDKLHSGPNSIATFRRQVIERLVGLPDQPKTPRQVGQFEVVESLPSHGVVRSLRARHSDGTERILKLVRPPVTMQLDRADQWRLASVREYDALKAAADVGHAPRVDPYFLWDQDRVYVFPVHPVRGKSLRADRISAQPGPKRIAGVLLKAFEALAKVHEAGVVHRALTPDRVHLGADDTTYFSDFAIARIDERATIADVASELLPNDFYRAPECRVELGLAEQASDVYSLFASIQYWATGIEPEEDALPTLSSQPSDWKKELFTLWTDLSHQCLREDERSRPTARAVVENIARILDHSTGASTGQGTEFAPGAVIQDRYRIVRELGSGGSATTYLADDLVVDFRVVLKRIRHPEFVRSLGLQEYKALRRLQHRNLPQVIDVYGAESPFHLKLEYVAGNSVRDLGEELRGDLSGVTRIALQVADALSFLDEHNLKHRDVSPGNILVPEDDQQPVRLIDFGIATSADGRQTLVGTPVYRAPEVEAGSNPWTHRADVYSLGVVLIEALLGRLPYRHGEMGNTKSEVLPPTPDELALAGNERILDVLFRACDPDPTKRYESAKVFASALRDAIASPVKVTVEGREVVNPFVQQLRQAYRNSVAGNADNRGLDTEFAESTYVPTRLDELLLPRLSGELGLPPAVVFLSGNPGDGKTAFLQRLRVRLVDLGGSVRDESAAGWSIQLKERRYASVYDASESHEGRSADEMLDEALTPLAGSEPAEVSYTAAIAINDGRLLSFFERYGERYAWLWRRVQSTLFRTDEQVDDVIVVDLKQRALVGQRSPEDSLVAGLVRRFTDEGNWRVCEDCAARKECPIRYNALSFASPDTSERTLASVHRLMLLTHLRREKRATIRDFRSALAYMLTGDRGCAEVHDVRARGISPLADREWLYFNAAHSGQGCPDLLLDEWKTMDPATIAAPRLDRHLWFHREPQFAPTIQRLVAQTGQKPMVPVASNGDADHDWLASMKRRYFFEGETEEAQHAGFVLPGRLMAYRYLEDFVAAVSADAADQSVLRRLLRGLSRSDGVPAEACEGTLSLTTSNATPEFCVIKRLPYEQFDLHRERDPGPYIEHMPDRLWLLHRSTGARLSIGLDLFELLMRASDGLVPAADEQRALLEELAAFKNHLLAQHTTEVALVEGGMRVHRVSVSDGIISLEEAAT